MKKWALLFLVVFGVAVAEGEVTVNVYEADGVTPFVDRDIMVGTKLTIIVSSDDDGYWSGGLFITGQDRALAELTARGWDPDTQDWMSSRYDTAGENALVWDYYDSLMWGFDLYTDSNAVAGDWFVIDYTAMETGDPNVGFHDYNVSWDDAISLICFSHIPTRDFNEDEIVNLVDYDLLASHWLATDCSDPCWCGQTDINTDGNVDFDDLILFTEYWLWTAPDWEPPDIPANSPSEPNEVYTADPNTIYSIIDANSMSEITMNLGDSITLYVDMVNIENNNVCMFEVEVNISDPNLGSIDNTAYDPNNPPGPGTARILASPRNEVFDYWGPGINQEEGIRLIGINMDTPMSDGNLASFVYTPTGEGDVNLNLMYLYSSNSNGEEVFPTLENIIIHQYDPNSQQMMGSGMSGTQESEIYQSTQEQSTQDIEEAVAFFEELWIVDEEIREMYSEAEWQEFIDSIKAHIDGSN